MIKFLLIVLCSFYLDLGAQTRWLMKDGRNPDYILTIAINDSVITGSTRKDALTDYVGQVKFNMIRSMSKLKFAEIIRFNALYTDRKREQFAGTFNYLFSEKTMRGRISGDSIWIELVTPGTALTEKITGIKTTAGAKRNYPLVIASIINLTKEHLYDQRFIQSEQWKSFEKAMTDISGKITDDLELQTGLISLARDFPFTHYFLSKTGSSDQPAVFRITALNPATCLLSIPAFTGPRKQMDSILSVIDRQHYKNLIIDLRDNGGGDNETAGSLLEFIAGREMIAGVFPNKNWYADSELPPSKADYEKFNIFKGGTLQQFYEQAQKGPGIVLHCIPSRQHFGGSVFVIVNKNTASTSEIIALALQENKLATIIGQPTAGAALSARKFRIDDDLSIMIPQNDYISFGGYRPDKKGVKPDTVIKNTDEVLYILNSLIK